MVKFKGTKYEKIVKELVNASFPILKDKKIKIKIINKFFSDFFKFSATADWDLYIWLTIRINPRYVVIYNNFELKGLLAHELSHLEDWISKGRIYKFLNCFRCACSDKYNEKYEKETDKRAICKGYRKELKAQRIKRESRKDKNFEKLKRFYLTPEEIDKVVC